MIRLVPLSGSAMRGGDPVGECVSVKGRERWDTRSDSPGALFRAPGCVEKALCFFVNGKVYGRATAQ